MGGASIKMAGKAHEEISESKEENMWKWTEERTETFISELKKYPCLYNTTMKEYHDRNERKNCYEALSQVMNVSGEYTIGLFTYLAIILLSML